MKIVRKLRNITSSSDLLQYTARYWAELIEEIESEGYEVDSADKHRPSQWITAYKNENEYEIEVNKYSDGTYEIVKADIVGSVYASTKTKVTASWDEDDSEWIKLNSKNVLDSDGFYTDYTLYTNGHEYICMFGDEDIYEPDPDYADFYTDSEEEAMEWFDSYDTDDYVEAATDDELEHPDQEYDSAATSINSNKLPAIYRMVEFKPGQLIVDLGGGKFDNGVYFVKDKGATLLVYDPYNRSDEHNQQVLAELKENGGADIGLNSNVLNVIKEPEARLAVLRNLKRMVKPGGEVYITVYEGTGKGNEGPTKAGYQLNRKTADYLEEVQSVFPNAVRKGKLIQAINSSIQTSGKQVYCTSIFASGTDIDAEELKGLSREQIEQILDEAPVGTKVLHIRNLKNRFNMDELIRKKQAYKSNYFNPVGAPRDFNNLDTYWELGGYEDPYIDKTIYTAINGTNRYYGLTSEVLKAHGITSSVRLGDEVEWNNQKYIVIDDEECLRLRPVDRFSEDDFNDMEAGDPSEDLYLADFQIEGASYGGAYDVLDEYYFTRDDLVDFGEEVVAQLENLEPGDYFVNDLDMLNPKTIHVEVYCRNKEMYVDKNIVIDMRRIHKPSDLNKYAHQVAADMYDEFSEYTGTDQYVSYDSIANYVHDHYSFEELGDKYSCINSLLESFKGEDRIAKDIIEQFVGAHNGTDAVTSSNDIGYSSFQDPRLQPPEYDDPEEVEDVTEYVETSWDGLIVTVDSEGFWEYENMDWAKSPDTKSGDWQSVDYPYTFRDPSDVVEDVDAIVEPFIPKASGVYKMSADFILEYNISNLYADYEYYSDGSYDEDLYYDNMEVTFNQPNSEVKNFKSVKVK